MLYSKNGSIPKPETDGTDGWIEVPEPPVAAEGQEVVWWFPPGWVVRPVMPAPVEGHCWSWSQSEVQWILWEDHAHAPTPPTEPTTLPPEPTTSGAETIVIDMGSSSGAETVSGG